MHAIRPFDPSRIPPTQFANFAFDQLDRARPLDLEIGAGQGLYAIRYCQANTNRILIAIEKTESRFARLIQRLNHHPAINNLIAVRADAVALVSQTLPTACLDRLFLFYPNPYPKTKQANLRWHNRPFIHLLLQKLKADAEIVLATNLQWYAEEARRSLVDIWGLRLISFDELDPCTRPRTHFEKKYLARGEKCWNLVLRKVQ